jgi:hypothetical protein
MTSQPDTYPDKVQAVVRILERAERWETIEVAEHSPGFWTISAERYPGTLASTSLSAYISTRRSRRGRYAGGHRYAFAGMDTKLRTWRDLRIWAGI